MNKIDELLSKSNEELKTSREKELDKLVRKEKEEYEQKKIEFYRNPLHWSNNKRRRYGLQTLRGITNKNRLKHYPTFHPTARLFGIIEDIIEETLQNKFENGELFNKFVEVKNFSFCK